MRQPTVSGRTLALTILMAAVIGVVAFAVSTSSSDASAYMLSSVGGVVSIGLAAAVCLASALSYGAGERVRRSWLLIGFGLALFAFGKALATYARVDETAFAIDRLADLCYLGSMPFLSVGMIYYALGFTELVDRRWPALVALGTIVVGIAAVWFTLVEPVLLAEESMTLAELVVAVEHPVFDVVLVVGPAVYLSAFIAALGAGRLGWPWWAVAGGALVLAVSDTAQTWMLAKDAYVVGSWVDYGPMIALSVVAVGSLLQRDVLDRRLA